MSPDARRGRKRWFTRFPSYRKRSTASAGRSSARSTSPSSRIALKKRRAARVAGGANSTHSPNCTDTLQFSCSLCRSERVAQRELERPWPTGAEEPAGSAHGCVEGRRRARGRQAGDVIDEARVVVVVETANVGDVEQIEDLADEPQLLALGKHPSASDTHIE